jgi:hypothetical protein
VINRRFVRILRERSECLLQRNGNEKKKEIARPSESVHYGIQGRDVWLDGWSDEVQVDGLRALYGTINSG